MSFASHDGHFSRVVIGVSRCFGQAFSVFHAASEAQPGALSGPCPVRANSSPLHAIDERSR